MLKLAQKLKNLPEKPGVYLFKNSTGEILYIGKAKKINARVKNYFNNSHPDSPKTQILVEQIADLEYIITDNETEALMLENTLIKKHQPRYNILLKDDKNYQFIKIDYSTQIPQIYSARRIEDKANTRPFPSYSAEASQDKQSLFSPGERNKKKTYRLQAKSYKLPVSTRSIRGGKANKYFGPYSSGLAVRETLRLVRYVFSYCANKKAGTNPCFYYHLGRCPGICIGKISPADYKQHLKKIERFLGGHMAETVAELRKDMHLESRKKHFEKAARLRDQIKSLERMLEKQKIISPKRESHDSLAVFRAGSLAAATLFQIRLGKLNARENFLLDNAKDASDAEILKAFMDRYYLETSDLPKEINIPVKIEELTALETLLGKKLGGKVSIKIPVRGRKKQLLTLARTNAQNYLETTSHNLAREQAVLTKALFELKDKLELKEIPFRIETYDISNTQGTSPTGSMVVFENGKPKKSDYKKFAIKLGENPNDFGMMKEMLERRLAHSPSDNLSWKLPDLIIVDGGRGQLNTALSALKKNKVKIPVFGLAKRLEEIYRPKYKATLRLPADSAGLQLLQRMRDEAHRFAITYHRKKRTRKLLSS